MLEQTLKNNLQGKILNFVKKNLKKLITLSALLILFLFIYLFYVNLKNKNEIKISEQYTKATVYFKQKKINESKLLLENIISQDHQFYSPLALYIMIDKNIEKDTSKIIILFDKILDNNSIENENLNLIKIKKAIYLINLNNEKLILETLNPIINSNSVWKNLAINLISEYFISNGQSIKANEYIKLLDKINNK